MKSVSEYQAEAGEISSNSSLTYCQALHRIAKDNGASDWQEFKCKIAPSNSQFIHLVLTRSKGLALLVSSEKPTIPEGEILLTEHHSVPLLVARRVKMLHPELPIIRSASGKGVRGNKSSVSACLSDVAHYSDFLWKPGSQLHVEPSHFEFGMSDFEFSCGHRYSLVRLIWALVAMRRRLDFFGPSHYDGFLDAVTASEYFNESEGALVYRMKELSKLGRGIRVSSLAASDLQVFEFCKYSNKELCWKFTKGFADIAHGYSTANPFIENISPRQSE